MIRRKKWNFALFVQNLVIVDYFQHNQQLEIGLLLPRYQFLRWWRITFWLLSDGQPSLPVQ
ncbi:hypothetical protein [Aeromonas salmonicida]|uniref:hypothetical protein n=1 Tax=Aeromonas salmonicida TaxID=645 RepID=UPI00370D0843